jgi:pimeloyl-ACP methyl ester carboxylesterase
MKFLFKTIGAGINFLSNVAPQVAGKIGMYLFCKPINPKITPDNKAFLQTAEIFIVGVNGKKVQCYKWGNGAKKILLVHGWGSYTYRWHYFIERLKNTNCTIYAFDAIAHGLSEGKNVHVEINAKTIIKVLENIGPIDTLFAHSFGGFSAVYAMEKAPNLPINNFIIMAAPENAESFFGFYQQLLGLSTKTLNLIVARFVQVLGNPPHYYKTSNFAKKITTPCLIIHDALDKETPYQGATDLHAAWQGSVLCTTKGFGHQMRNQKLSNWIIDGIVTDTLFTQPFNIVA